MRILVVSDLPQFVTGGAEKQAANLIEAWMDAGHDVVCFGRRMGTAPVKFGQHEPLVRRIRTIQNLGRLVRGASYFLSLATLLLRHRDRFDVIFTQFLGEAAITASMLKRLNLLNTPLVATPASTLGAGDANFLRRLPFRTWLVRCLDSECDAIDLIAPAMDSELREIGFSGKNFTYIPNGVAVHDEPPGHGRRPHMFIAVGRLAPEKGFDVLITSLAMLRPPPYPGMVRIAGAGPKRTTLEDQAAKLGVSQSIEWLGELDHDSVIKELGQAQVFLLPSRYEGMSNAGLEAMERGCAMVMARCEGLDTYVQADMGWVMEPGDPRGLAIALEAALSSGPTILEAMGQLNRALVLKNFDLQLVASCYLRLFAKLIAARGARSRHD